MHINMTKLAGPGFKDLTQGACNLLFNYGK